MLLIIAWRNIWRNPRRSWVLLTAIAVGIFCFVASTAFMDSLAFQMLDSAIELQGGDLQVAARGYFANPTLRKYLPDSNRVTQALRGIPGLHYAPQVASMGMASSSARAAGVTIRGVDAAREPRVTAIAASVTEGRYLAPDGAPDAIVIGEELARQLDVRTGEKVVLMVNDLHNELSAGAYRVVGLFRTNSLSFDKANVYLHLQEAQRFLGYTRQVSTVSVRLDRDVSLDETAARLRQALRDPGMEVLSWKDRFPLLVVSMDAYDYMVAVMAVLLFTAVAFTIINSFLMVIFERVHEIGVMMANGVRPRQIRLMLYLETACMVVLGTGCGAVLSAVLIGYWDLAGLNLSAFARGLGAFGISTVVYPYLDWSHLLIGFAAIVAVVLLAVLYPAFKAGRLEAVEAIRYV